MADEKATRDFIIVLCQLSYASTHVAVAGFEPATPMSSDNPESTTRQKLYVTVEGEGAG